MAASWADVSLLGDPAVAPDVGAGASATYAIHQQSSTDTGHGHGLIDGRSTNNSTDALGMRERYQW